MARKIDRRRFIRIAAVVGAVAATAGLPFSFASAKIPHYRWRGVALGAKSEIVIASEDIEIAKRMVERAVAEIRRLEKEFSLYQDGSALTRLNQDGYLAAPSMDMVRLLAAADESFTATGGAFDATVQPLWTLYSDGKMPSSEQVKRVRDLVGWAGVRFDQRRVTLAKKGMGLTFNGIGQGYVTDRVADLLKRMGADHVLLNLGEARAIGGRGDGTAWQVGLEDQQNPSGFDRLVGLRDMALATSAVTPGFSHLFDPRDPEQGPRFTRVSVLAKTATVADALSTGLCFMPEEQIERCLQKAGAERAILKRSNGSTIDISA